MSRIPRSADAQQEMLKALFERYYDRLLYFAWQYVHDKETARDLVQDAFITYWRNAANIADEETPIKNYLYLTVKHACLKHLRHNEVVGKYYNTLEADPQEEALGHYRIVRAEVISEIHQAIAGLPQPLRKISQMSYLEGLKNQEIADQLNMPLNTVKSHKQKALQALRLRLHPDNFVALLLVIKLLR
jgi:RNA polymerase sigma-70 factor (ECF subfamily)